MIQKLRKMTLLVMFFKAQIPLAFDFFLLTLKVFDLTPRVQYINQTMQI
jgi:hypothetical protein